MSISTTGIGGCRCSFRDCENTTRVSENINFFHFPIKNPQRCMKWIQNAQKPSFYDLDENQLKNKVICHVHFEDKWFTNLHCKRLLPGAVPTRDEIKPITVVTVPINKNLKDAQPLQEETKADIKSEFKSNQYNDVQILAANEDKTVFYLDAENMFTESNKIESYVIKNGQLVPSNSDRPKAVAKRQRSRANPLLFKAYQSKLLELGVPPDHVLSSPPAKQPKQEPDKQQTLKEITIKKEVIDPAYPQTNSPQKPPIHPKKQPDQIIAEYQGFESIEVHHQAEKEDSKSSLEKLSREKLALENNYLKKIKQHSKEIASIKKMLAQKNLSFTQEKEKPDISTSFSVISEKLPITLRTIISLILGVKNDLTEDDVEFFTTLHRTSPEAYQLLSDKYGWNLPSVDVVETDE